MTMRLSPLPAAPSPDIGRLPRTDEIPDTLANRDVFWFAPDTVIMDAQNVDLLFYGGAPLTGGDAIAFSTLLQASNGGGSVFTLANIIAKSAEASLGEWVKQLGKKTKAGRALTPVFFDAFLPFITYQIVRNTDGGVDLVIGNVSDALWNVGGKSAIYDPLKPDAAGYSYQGLMTVKNFDAAFGQEGSKQKDLKGKGDLGLVFKFYGVNDFAGLVPIEIAGPIGMSVLAAAQTLAVADAMFTLSAAADRYAEAIRWKAANDPLVIDLDGDGIETVGAGLGRTYFDVDGDLFREETGWLTVRARESGGRGGAVADWEGAAFAAVNDNDAWRGAALHFRQGIAA